MRKRISRRRLKRAFLRGQHLALEVCYERDLVKFIKRHGYRTTESAMIYHHPTLEQRVHSNLDDALANDYDVRGWLIDDIVTDLICFAADCEDDEPDNIRPHVLTWLALRRTLQ